MSYKRSRADFESDAPYVLYGTALPPLDPDIRDDGSFVPVWKQDAVDERGRKRFHGAFTGGFSAGYFNTVGSKEGWSPATFVSSRKNRAKDQNSNGQQRQAQTADDFMDEEDLADQEQSRQLQTNDAFAGLGTTADDTRRRDALVDLMLPTKSMGVQLLKKMGWREGQGIGAKVHKRMQTNGSGVETMHSVAPVNTRMITFMKKTDRKGLGLSEIPFSEDQNGHDDAEPTAAEYLAQSRSRFVKSSKPSKKSSFGVGVLNDNGSDDEDPYENGPKISYNRTVGPVKKPKKPKKPGKASNALTSTTSNPLISNRPVFVKKKVKLPTSMQIRKCHDGRLPLDGFILTASPYNPSFFSQFPPPKVPAEWKSTKTPLNAPAADENATANRTYQSTADAARASTMDPKSRASLLGEAQLPGKSVFDYMSPAARNRLAAATGNQNLPRAGNEDAPAAFRKSEADRQQQQLQFVVPLDSALAKAALDRANAAGGGFMPYADDSGKRARYRSFLELHAGHQQQKTLPLRAPSVSNDEWAAEMREFAQAAQVFRPMTGLMASRFTSSSSVGPSADPDKLLSTPSKPVDPAEQAAQMGMYGPLTRSVDSWAPNHLLCKRFGVRPPAVVDPDDGNDTHSAGYNSSSARNAAAQKFMAFSLALSAPPTPSSDQSTPVAEQSTTSIAQPPAFMPAAAEPLAEVNVERNEALEGKRPGDDVFKAIFGSDDEDDEDDD